MKRSKADRECGCEMLQLPWKPNVQNSVSLLVSDDDLVSQHPVPRAVLDNSSYTVPLLSFLRSGYGCSSKNPREVRGVDGHE